MASGICVQVNQRRQTMTTRTLMLAVVAAGFALGGCTSMQEYGATARQDVRNAQGDVVGYKQMLRDEKSGEVAAQMSMYTPITNDDGETIAYEERTANGAVIRDLNGRRIGERFIDNRSRANNPKTKGITIIIGSLDTRRV